MKIIPFVASIVAFVGVCLGAFGAHGLKALLLQNATVEVWQTAVHYHLLHAVAAWAIGFAPDSSPPLRRAGIAWLVGILLFSGSLYGLALGGPKFLGPITPLGGLSFLLGWTFAGQSAWSNRAKA
jgi:uncharacterized membrane protein YgdD (TMEM256/DUF423 family)